MTFWEFLNRQGNRVTFKMVLSLIMVTFGFIVFYGVLFSHRANTESQINVQLITAVIALVTGVSLYWFGSTSGSAKKDDAIIGRMPAQVDAVNAIPTDSNDSHIKINQLLIKQKGFNPETDEYKAIQDEIDRISKQTGAIK